MLKYAVRLVIYINYKSLSCFSAQSTSDGNHLSKKARIIVRKSLVEQVKKS